MSIELKKEVVQLNETTCQMSCETFVEADIIVPDIKPDIARILQIDATPVIMGKSIYTDKVVFEGQIELCIMYISDDGCVKSIRSCHKFMHTMMPKGLDESMHLEAYSVLVNLDHRLINSRKLSVSATVGIDFTVTREVEVDLTVDVADQDACQCLHEPATAYIAARPVTEEIMIRETMEVPVGKPDVDEILTMDARVCNKDVRITGNKAVVKGDVMCTMLYASGYDSSFVQNMEQELGFTEIIDIPMGLDDYDSDVDFIIKIINSSVKQDGDGDNRVVLVEIVMDAVVRMANTATFNILADTYSTSKDLIISKKQLQLDEMIADLKMQSTFKSSAAIPDNAPEIIQIYNVMATPHLGEAVLQKGAVQISGEVELTVIYQSSEMNMPVNSFRHIMPYAQTLEAERADIGMICDVNVSVDHVGYNMNMANEVDLRCILSLSAKVMNPRMANIIESIEEEELPTSEINNKYCIKIYFVQQHDTLWNISKRYHVCIDKLIEANGLDENVELKAGQQIIIPL